MLVFVYLKNTQILNIMTIIGISSFYPFKSTFVSSRALLSIDNIANAYSIFILISSLLIIKYT